MFCFEVFYNAPIREKQNEQRKIAAAIKAEQVQADKENLLDNIKEKEFIIETPRTEQEIKEFLQNREEVLSKAARVKIDNGVVHGSINLQGARFDDVTLANYHLTIDENSPEVVLASPSGSYNSNFIETGYLANETATPNSKTIWEVVEGEVLTASTPITLSWDNSAGVIFQKKISVDDEFMFTIEDSIANNSGEKIALKPYGLISKKRPTKIEDSALGIPDHSGALTIVDQAVEEINFDTIADEKSVTQAVASDWIGVTDKYWLKAILPQEKKFATNFRYAEKADKFQIDYAADEISVSAGEKATYTNRIFIGVKRLKTLEQYAEKYDVHLFDRAVNFGWLYFLCEPLYQLLLIFYGWVGNWGVAIIMLTLCVKLLLFPLSRKAYISMGKMKLIAPKIKEVQEKYKDNRAELSQHMMAVYKKEGVNPAAGCLPILLQIPFFIALYRLIYSAVEMRHAPFFGWIQDLSAPDPTSFWNLFGALPYDSPTFLAIGVWPIIMCITMYMQQSLNPPMADPMQAKFMKALPFLFLFMFHSFPAGLIIYWSFSNIITFSQQFYFTRKLQHLKPSEVSKYGKD